LLPYIKPGPSAAAPPFRSDQPTRLLKIQGESHPAKIGA